jgi:hypothetical protein
MPIQLQEQCALQYRQNLRRLWMQEVNLYIIPNPFIFD